MLKVDHPEFHYYSLKSADYVTKIFYMTLEKLKHTPCPEEYSLYTMNPHVYMMCEMTATGKLYRV
jgi:hypothetical protein